MITVSKIVNSPIKIQNKIKNKAPTTVNKKSIIKIQPPIYTVDSIPMAELINGRCAILGLTTGKCFEYITNETIQQQCVEYYPYILLSTLLVATPTVIFGKPGIPDTFIPSIAETELSIGRLAMMLFGFYFYTGV